jgi:LmbE family N-acetylglucosaminyl deacetylase
VLCVGAHCDDIEIGCGGTLLKLLSERLDISVDWVVFSSTTERAREARESAAGFLSRAAKSSVAIHAFRDGYLPYEGRKIKELFDEMGSRMRPDLVFTHYGRDAHQDHRLVNELTWNTFRDHLILEYEIPKYDGDLGTPNVFVSLPKEAAERKVELIMRYFNTQGTKSWFNQETFLSLLRLRGMEIRATDGMAEAFYCRKLAL